MGSNNSKSAQSAKSGLSAPQGQMMRQTTCTDDLMCQNIDSKRSKPGKDPVLVCPNAKCVAGSCQCGPDCEKDPYTGMCCSEIEERTIPGSNQKTTFCIEKATVSGESKELFMSLK